MKRREYVLVKNREHCWFGLLVQNAPCSIVNLTILQLKMGASSGLAMILNEQSMLMNFIACNVFSFVILGRSLTCSAVILASVVWSTDSSLNTKFMSMSLGKSSPRFERTVKMLFTASSNLADAARSLARRIDDVRLSSKDLTLALISVKQEDMVSTSPRVQLTDADISYSSKLSRY